MRYVLGVDGGATKTVAVIANGAGEELSRFETGSSNRNRVGDVEALANLTGAIDGALTALGLSCVDAGVVGVSGKNPDYHSLLARYAGALEVVGDGELPLGLCPDGVGVALVAGTGSVCLGRGSQGGILTVGGHGGDYDEGSATWLARAAIDSLTRIVDGRLTGRDVQAFERALMGTIGDGGLRDLYRQLYREGEEARAALFGLVAPLVMGLAAQSNTVALGLAQRGAAELALMAATAVRRLALAEPVLVLTGSVIVKNPFYQDLLCAQLSAMDVRIAGGTPAILEESVQGAIARAKQML